MKKRRKKILTNCIIYFCSILIKAIDVFSLISSNYGTAPNDNYIHIVEKHSGDDVIVISANCDSNRTNQCLGSTIRDHLMSPS